MLCVHGQFVFLIELASVGVVVGGEQRATDLGRSVLPMELLSNKKYEKILQTSMDTLKCVVQRRLKGTSIS